MIVLVDVKCCVFVLRCVGSVPCLCLLCNALLLICVCFVCVCFVRNCVVAIGCV